MSSGGQSRGRGAFLACAHRGRACVSASPRVSVFIRVWCKTLRIVFRPKYIRLTHTHRRTQVLTHVPGAVPPQGTVHPEAPGEVSQLLREGRRLAAAAVPGSRRARAVRARAPVGSVPAQGPAYGALVGPCGGGSAAAESAGGPGSSHAGRRAERASRCPVRGRPFLCSWLYVLRAVFFHIRRNSVGILLFQSPASGWEPHDVICGLRVALWFRFSVELGGKTRAHRPVRGPGSPCSRVARCRS